MSHAPFGHYIDQAVTLYPDRHQISGLNRVVLGNTNVLYMAVLYFSPIVPIVALCLLGAAITQGRYRMTRRSRRKRESLMSLAEQTPLTCVCWEGEQSGLGSDPGEPCRRCGLQIVPRGASRLDLQQSRSEIQAATRTLRQLALRAGHLDLPDTVTNIQELEAYLEGAGHKRTIKVPGSRPSPEDENSPR